MWEFGLTRHLFRLMAYQSCSIESNRSTRSVTREEVLPCGEQGHTSFGTPQSSETGLDFLVVRLATLLTRWIYRTFPVAPMQTTWSIRISSIILTTRH